MKFVQVFVLVFLTCCVSNFSDKKSLADELERLGIKTVLVFNSQEIDEYPLWSQNSDSVSVNVMGEWRKFDLKKVKLIEAKWHEQKIGALLDGGSLLLTRPEFEALKSETKISYGGREVVTKSGDKIEMRLQSFSTSLILTKAGQSPEVLWKTNLENCHSLSLSPNQMYVAYLCELNGLFLMRIGE